MSLTLAEQLKFNLQESKFPYFSDTDLTTLLEVCNNDIDAATAKGLRMKAQGMQDFSIGSVKVSANNSVWLSSADAYESQSKLNSTDTTVTVVTGMKRADGR